MYHAPSRVTGISCRPIHSPQSQHAPHAPLASSYHVLIIEWSHVILTRPASKPDPRPTPFVLYSGLKKKNQIKFQNLKIEKKKIIIIIIKKGRKLVETSEEKIKIKPFIFLCMPFVLFAIFKKKKIKFRISKFENSKKRKENWH